MSLQKIIIIAIVVIIAGVGIAAYLRPTQDAYAPSAPSQAVTTPPPAPTEEQELGAIPVDDLGKEMQDIDAELAP